MKNDCAAVRRGRQNNIGMPMKGFQNVFPNLLSTWKEDIADNQVELLGFRSLSWQRVGYIFLSDFNI